MVTKCVIAAAGRGTRFLPVVKGYPKELIAIIDKPNIQYLIEEAIGAEITQIAIVHRSNEHSIEKYFTPDPELTSYLTKNNKLDRLNSLENIWSKAKLTFIEQPPSLPYGNASPLLAAKDFIGNDNFVYMFGDDLTVEPTPGQFLSKMINTFKQHQPAIVAAVKDVGKEEISRYGSAKYVDDPKYPNRISAMLEKLPADQAPSTMAQGGRFVVSAAKIFPVLEKQGLSRDNELWFADAENTLAQTDIVLTESFENEVDWLTTGDPLHWLQANITLALQNPALHNDLVKFIQKIR